MGPPRFRNPSPTNALLRSRWYIMPKTLHAIRYRNLDQASAVLQQQLGKHTDEILTDEDGEPDGLLSVVVEDQLSPELFHRLLDSDKGVLVKVERRNYSGYGPPAESEHYMAYASRQVCYVLAGCAWSIEIENCPLRAIDLHHLEAMVMSGQHPLDREVIQRHFELAENWDFEELLELVADGTTTAQAIDELLHR